MTGWIWICSANLAAVAPTCVCVVPQVQFAEAVDRALAHMVRRLWEAEEAAVAAGDDGDADEARPRQYKEAIPGGIPGQRYCLAVTGSGSGSTPAMSDGASHEPVPFAIAHVRHVVSSRGMHGLQCVGECMDQ